jgi:hypothetical protein
MEETESFKGIMSVKEIKYPKADKLLNELLKNSRVDAGYFEGVMHKKGAGDMSGGQTSMADIAFWNEMGIGMPARPFMTRAIETAEKEIVAFAYAEMRKDSYTAERFYKRLGLFLVAKIKEQVKTSKSWAEENKESTIRQKTRAGKRGDQPLVDWGNLMRTADFKAIHNSMFKRFTL